MRWSLQRPAASLSAKTGDLRRFSPRRGGSRGEGRGWEQDLAGRCVRRGEGCSSPFPGETVSEWLLLGIPLTPLTLGTLEDDWWATASAKTGRFSFARSCYQMRCLTRGGEIRARRGDRTVSAVTA